MKKTIVLLLCFALSLPMAAMAEVDLSGMSYEELVALKDQINLAMWKSEEWQEVEVPQGVWKVGEDIPAGKWTIRPVEGYVVRMYWGDMLDDTGTSLSTYGQLFEYGRAVSPKKRNYDSVADVTEISWELEDGQYLIVESGHAVFTPYSGKPSLGFK